MDTEHWLSTGNSAITDFIKFLNDVFFNLL